MVHDVEHRFICAHAICVSLERFLLRSMAFFFHLSCLFSSYWVLRGNLMWGVAVWMKSAFCKYFLFICSLSFTMLKVFWKAGAFHFCEGQFTNPCMDHSYSLVPRKLLSNPPRFSPTLFSRIAIVLYFTLWSIIHFKSCFVLFWGAFYSFKLPLWQMYVCV